MCSTNVWLLYTHVYKLQQKAVICFLVDGNNLAFIGKCFRYSVVSDRYYWLHCLVIIFFWFTHLIELHFWPIYFMHKGDLRFCLFLILDISEAFKVALSCSEFKFISQPLHINNKANEIICSENEFYLPGFKCQEKFFIQHLLWVIYFSRQVTEILGCLVMH